MRSFVLLLILFAGCSTSKKFYTDTYRFKTTDGKEYTVTQEYWESIEIDEYIKWWMISQKGVDPRTVTSFELADRKFVIHKNR